LTTFNLGSGKQKRINHESTKVSKHEIILFFRVFVISCFGDIFFSENVYFAKLALIDATNSLVSLGGAGKSGLASIAMASNSKPVAQTAHPKHRSRSTTSIVVLLKFLKANFVASAPYKSD
jgi:hypothetical protein